MKSFALQFLVGLAAKMISLMEKRPKILNLKFWASSVKFQRLTTILIFECFIEQIQANFTISNLTRFCSPEITQNVQETLFCKMIGYLRPLETFPATTNRWVMRLTKISVLSSFCLKKKVIGRAHMEYFSCFLPVSG